MAVYQELVHKAENIHVLNDHCIDVMTTVDSELSIVKVENGCN